jgi:dolichol-phosphate mannosyltransferase
VNDNRPDGTTQEVRRIASSDRRVRCIRRIGRRGLADERLSVTPMIAKLDAALAASPGRLSM